MRLGEILIRYYDIPETTVEGAANAQQAVCRKLGDVLVTLGALQEEDLARALAFQSRLPVSLGVAQMEISREVIRLVPSVIAAWEQIVPVSKTMGRDGKPVLLVAMTHPEDTALIEELEQITHCVVQAAVGTESDLREAVRRFYGAPDPYAPEMPGPIPASSPVHVGSTEV